MTEYKTVIVYILESKEKGAWCKHTTSVSCVFCLDAQLYTSIQKEQLEDNLRYFLHEHKINACILRQL